MLAVCLSPCTYSLTTLADEPMRERLIAAILKDEDPWKTGTQDIGYTLIERMGPRAFRLLLPLVERSKTAAAKSAHAESLCIIESDQVSVLFRERINEKRFKKIATAYLRRFGG